MSDTARAKGAHQRDGRIDGRAKDLVAALEAVGVIEVDAGARRRAEYATDASLYRIPPLAVAFPRDADEVEAALAAARSVSVPITARGSGTSIAGNAIGPGLVLDLRRHLHRIHDIDPDARTVQVEPGAVLDDVQRALAPHGLRIGPDPSTHDRCTIGGMIGNNACGSRALGYGRTVDNVEALDVITGSGHRFVAGPGGPRSSPTAVAALAFAGEHAPLLRTHLDRFSRQVSGYGLHHLLPEHAANVARALVGSEGTCALTVDATLRTLPRPATTVLVVLGYPDMPAAADATPGLLGHDAIAIEGMDARIPDTVRARRGDAAVPPLPRGGGWLLVEFAGDDVDEVRARALAVVADAAAIDHRMVVAPAEQRAVWGIREAGAGLVARASPTPAHAGWEDAAVPPEHLGAYLRRFEQLLDTHGLHGVPYGHFGDGCVHVRIDFPFHRPDGQAVFRTFLTEAADLVVGFGGSLSGEHGDGRARSELLTRMYPSEVLAAFGRFKGVFDPDGNLNPGVLVDPEPVDGQLRTPATGQPRGATSGFRYEEDNGQFAAAVHRCTGVGRCTNTTSEPDRVMCPSFQVTGDERDSTRGRARVLQEVVDGDLFVDGLASPEVHDALDLCLACKGCASDCPTSVDMATYRAEVLYQTYRGRRRPRTHYSLGRLPRWLRLASRLPRPLRAMAGWRPITRFVKALAGVDRARSVPDLTTTAFRRDPRVETVSGPGRPVAWLWVDTFTDYLAPDIARDAAIVLTDAGYEVRVARGGGCCGLTWISTGQLDAAREMIRGLVDELDRDVATAPGSIVVGLEPSCTAVLREEAAKLHGGADEAVTRVAGVTRTLAEALMARRPAWSPPRLEELRVIAQPHCHHHAVMGWQVDRALLAATGATVEVVGGCCGLAGDFGVRRGYVEVSKAIAETALLPAIRAAEDGVVVLADGYSCRTQVADLAGRPSRHLAGLLADGVRARAS